MIGINILDYHERDCQFEKFCVEKFRHFRVIFIKQGQNSIDFLDFSLPHAQLILIVVIGQVNAIYGIVCLC